MSKHILITGGTGFIGSALVPRLLQAGHTITVLTRSPERANRQFQNTVSAVSAVSSLSDVTSPVDWLINLAGEGIADKRWSDSRKQALRDSRIGLTESLVRWANDTDQQFELVLTGSAIGIYGGFAGAHPSCDESSPLGNDFSANLCIDWEAAGEKLSSRAKRVVRLRTGLVLGPNGGMLNRMWLPFSFGLGGTIGQGEQVLSWIHIEDYLNAIDHICSHSVSGAVNMTAPYPVSNAEFTAALASALKRPALLPMPTVMAKLAFGEMSELLLRGQKVLPEALLRDEFTFRYPNVRQALEQIASVW